MIKQFCTYEISLKLKELGFDEECLLNVRSGTHAFCNGYDFKSYAFPILNQDMFINHQLNPLYNIKIPLWQQAIAFVNKFGYVSISSNFDDLDDLERDILLTIDLIKTNTITK